MTATFAEGDLVRVTGWRNQVFRLTRVRLDGTVDLWGGPPHRASLRTVTADRLLPAQPGDVRRAPAGLKR